MGISNLSALIQPYSIVSVKENYMNKLLGIDTASIMYSSIINIRKKNKGQDYVTKSGQMSSHLYVLLEKITMFLENGINTFWIFDGGYPSLKDKTIKKRQNRKKKAKQIMTNLSPHHVDYVKYAKRCIHLRPQQYVEMITLLKLLGVPSIIALEEADAQCAAMYKAGKIQGIISNDLDILTFGGSMLLNDFNFNKYTSVISLPTILTQLNLTREQFIELCIILGTDYCSGVRGQKPQKLYDIYCRFLDIPSFLEYINTKNINNIKKYNKLKYIIPANFSILWMQIKDYYMNTLVINPCDEQINFEWQQPNKKLLINYLVNNFDFNKNYVVSKINKICAIYEKYNVNGKIFK